VTPQARTDDVLRRVQEAGGRITVPTRLVVSILADCDRHPTADDLIATIEVRSPGIAPSTIYRVLQRLDEMGLLEHVHSGNGPAFYHLADHRHAHLLCTECGTVTDVGGPAAEALRHLHTVVRDTSAFEIESHHAALLGRCARCSTGTRNSVIESASGDELSSVHHR
jgi:Fur family ferric uptake transcriptional regulator